MRGLLGRGCLLVDGIKVELHPSTGHRSDTMKEG